MLPHRGQRLGLGGSVRVGKNGKLQQFAGDTVAVMVKHGAYGGADGQAASLEYVQRHMARIIWLWSTEHRERPRLNA